MLWSVKSMPLTKSDEYKLLHLLLDIGQMMLCSGGEVHRVENTLALMGRAYGAEEISVFVITSSIVLTVKFSDGNEITETRRVLGSGSNNLQRLEALNDLSRRCCSKPLPVSDLQKAVKQCDRPINKCRFFFGAALAAGSFAIFFGGNVFDGIFAALFGIVICFMSSGFSHICPNNIVFNIISSLILGIGICMCAKIIPIISADKIMIGDIMLLIPGIAMTNSIRDILVGDTISGIMRIIESMLWAAGLAVGFMLSIWLVGGISI